MDFHIHEPLMDTCTRPRHFTVHQWYEQPVGIAEAQIFYKPSRDAVTLIKRKAARRLARWWRKERSRPVMTPSEKFLEAKRQRFTAEGRNERIASSLAALSAAPRINLTPDLWRQIIEDSDLEDQF